MMRCARPSLKPPSAFFVVAAEQDRQKLREEAAGKTYNAMAPPVAAYTSEVALASVESSLAGGTSAAAQAAAAAKAIEDKRALLARSTAELDEEARKRAEQVGTGPLRSLDCSAVHCSSACNVYRSPM